MDTTLRQTLEHKISQKMIQSVNILQMNSQELNDYIKQISLENPFIDVNDEFEYRKNEDTIKISEYNISSFELQNVDYSLSSDENSFENIYVPQEETLCENLLSQLLCGDYTKEEREIFFYIATSLDNN
jgi:sigma-54 factor, activator interacting domain (AID)